MMKQYDVVLSIALFLFVILHSSLSNPFGKDSRKPRKLIIDTDAGGDDAVGILLALNYEKTHKNIEIIAITCTNGNTEEKNVEINVLKILTVAQRNDISVYGGAEKSLIRNFNGSRVYGNDGLGDFKFAGEITTKIDKSKIAAVALIDLVKYYPGEVSILALGPLTNIALAIKIDSSFMKNVKELIIMGSSVSGFGNASPNVEFNFAVDPESNFIVLNSTKKFITLIPWEVSLNFPIRKEWRKNVFGQLNSTAVNFLNKAEHKSLATTKENWFTIDAQTVSIFLWSDMIKKFLVTNVTPIYDGAAMGSVLVDYMNRTGKPNNAKIIQAYDIELFKTKLLKYFSA